MDHWIDFFKSELNMIAELPLQEYKSGNSFFINFNDMYLNGDLDVSLKRIKKLEFGRMVIQSNGEESNWIKGVFRNDKPNFIEFLQTSWFGEEGEMYAAEFSKTAIVKVREFLKIPLYYGWLEEEYYLDEDAYYKVAIKIFEGTVKEERWSVTILDFGEQDIPMLFDNVDQWVRVKIADAWFNNKRRKINRIKVEPLKK